MENISLKTIGKQIRQQRKLRKLSILELGKIVGKSKSSISGYENGKKEPKAITFLKLIKTLDLKF